MSHSAAWGVIEIGNNVFANNGTSIAAKEKIEIGDNCIIGAGCIVSGDVPCNSLVRSVSNQTIEARRDIQDG